MGEKRLTVQWDNADFNLQRNGTMLASCIAAKCSQNRGRHFNADNVMFRTHKFALVQLLFWMRELFGSFWEGYINPCEDSRLG